MISSDHGGLLWENMPEPRKGHGGQTDKEMHVPMFLRGKLSVILMNTKLLKGEEFLYQNTMPCAQ